MHGRPKQTKVLDEEEKAALASKIAKYRALEGAILAQVGEADRPLDWCGRHVDFPITPHPNRSERPARTPLTPWLSPLSFLR